MTAPAKSLPAATLLLLAFASPPTLAAEASSLELFEKHVRPTLLDECIRCHGPEKQRGGLRLDSREGLLKGGDSGAAVKAGDPESSLLIRAIRYEDVELEMPPRGRLPDDVVAAIENWVKLGAHDPRVPKQTDTPAGPSSPTIAEGRSFWSFQPIRQPAVPDVVDQSWPRTEIDRFVLAKLEQSQLHPVDDADRESLIRRIYYDLIGLPPTPAQVLAFVTDHSENAYEKVIDQLLESPHFGERWGRHWLDAVRFAESSGGGRTLLFPNAWRYRDYVIESFNNDLPYDQFIQQQIAGDLLPHSDWRDRRSKLIATAFLLLGPTNYELQDKEILEMDIVDEQLDTIGKAFMGMTIGCARCHDHKFDPIPARDYYALAGILKSTQAVIHSNVSTWNKVDLPLPPDAEAAITAHEQQIELAKRRLAKATKAWKRAGGEQPAAKKSIDPGVLFGIVIDDTAAEKVGQWMESTHTGGFVGGNYVHDKTEAKGDKRVIYHAKLPAAGAYEVRISHTPGSNRSTRVPIHVQHVGGESVVKVNQKNAAPIDGVFTSLGSYQFDPAGDPRVVVSNAGTEDGVVIADAVVFIAQDSTQPASSGTAKQTSAVQIDQEQLVDQEQLAELQRAVDDAKAELGQLQKSGPQRPVAMATVDEQSPGDIHLAIRGVVHNQGPLIPRGVLQVAAIDPFPSISSDGSGRLELATWIANAQHPLTARVMANRVWYWLTGRGLVSTVDNFGRTGQTPTHPELLDHLATELIDQGWSIKKLVRQIMLSRTYQLGTTADSANQQLDPENRLLWRRNRKRLRAEDIRDTLLFVAGTLDLQSGGPTIKSGTSIEYGYQFDSRRRSVYLPVFRNTLPEILEAFDFADPNIQQGQRTSSTIASQALLLMNHPFVIEQAKTAAAALPADTQFDTLAGVQHAYYQVLGRAPSRQERSIAIEFMDRRAADSGRADRWAMLYQTLFECVDFRYLN